MSNVATASRSRDAAIEIAARSLVAHGTTNATRDQLVSLRAIDHHWHGLFQYAAIRVGAERAGELLNALPNTQSAPDISATHAVCDTYRRMRALWMASEFSSQQPASVHYWSTRDVGRNALLQQLRERFTQTIAEVIELHFTRGLHLQDVAEVTGQDVAAVTQHCEQASAIAQSLVGKRPKRDELKPERLLAEAFSLDPRLTPAPSRRPAPQVVSPGDVVADRYQIDGLLGSGSFADVYRAHDRDVEGHVVALKMTRAEHHDERSVQRGLRELQLIASVFHPSVVQLKDHGWHRGHLWFVMPLYRGETLGTRLLRGPLDRHEARSVFTPLAEALATMHRAGVLHQDIKPDNIFLADIGPSEQDLGTAHRVLPVLLDLGVAAKDAEVVLAGTPAYLAPEVAARFAAMPEPAPVGPKADVFSLALTLRDALDPDAALDAPITSVDTFLAQRAVTAPAPPQRHALRDMHKAFGRWLNTSPDARPSAAELCNELALLTLPSERAMRRNATLRWVVPTTVALLSLFGFVVYMLSQEAALQRAEAALARTDATRAVERVASIHADLTEQQARRKELEANIVQLNQDYSESRLTRAQLAAHITETHAQLQLAEDRIHRQEQQLTELNTQLANQAAERRQNEQILLETQQAVLNGERQLERLRDRAEADRVAGTERREQLEQRLTGLELALEQSRREVERLRHAATMANAALKRTRLED